MVAQRFPQYSPVFTLRINGDPLPPAMRASISRLSYQDGLEGADRVELTLVNERLRWLDHPLLQVEHELRLSIGYAPDAPEEVFVGEITGVDASFPSGAIPTMTVVAHDFLQRLTVGSKDRAFARNIPCIGKFPLPDDQIASLLAEANHLIPDVDSVGAALSFLTLLVAYAIDPLEAKNEVRIQRGQSDFDFLSMLAKENGWEMYIDHTAQPRGQVLRFRFLIQDFAPSAVLKWGESLIDFTPKISTVGQVLGIATRIWVPSIKKEFVVVLSWNFEKALFDLEIFPSTDNLETLVGEQRARELLRVEALGPATAPRKILGELLPRLNSRQTASANAVGDPRLKAGTVIDVAGLGGQLGGLYRVTSANHTIDGGGYRTAFDARKEVWFDALPRPSGSGGLVRVLGQAFQ
jgi:hypothetical protein